MFTYILFIMYCILVYALYSRLQSVTIREKKSSNQGLPTPTAAWSTHPLHHAYLLINIYVKVRT